MKRNSIKILAAIGILAISSITKVVGQKEEGVIPNSGHQEFLTLVLPGKSGKLVNIDQNTELKVVINNVVSLTTRMEKLIFDVLKK